VKSVVNWPKPNPDPTVEALKKISQEIATDDASPTAFDWDDEPVGPAISSSESKLKPQAVSQVHVKPFENLVKREVSRPVEPAPHSNERPPLREGDRFASLGQRFAFSKFYAWCLIALIAVGAYVFVWSSKPHAVQPASPPAGTASSPVQTAVGSNSVPPSVHDQAATSLNGQLVSLERRLANLEQGIEEIKTAQAKSTGANAEFGNSLKLAQEKLALSVRDLANALRAAEERAMQERSAVAEQLKLNQEQLAKLSEQLKASQEQIDRLKSRVQRAERSAPTQPAPSNAASPPPNAPATRSAAPKPPPQQARATPPQNSGPAQPPR